MRKLQEVDKILMEYLKYPLFLSNHQPGARSAVSAGHGGWTGAGVGGCSMELAPRRFVGRWTLCLICCCSAGRITSSCECALHTVQVVQIISRLGDLQSVVKLPNPVIFLL